jgi:hypothetical protein
MRNIDGQGLAFDAILNFIFEPVISCVITNSAPLFTTVGAPRVPVFLLFNMKLRFFTLQ